MTTNDGSAQEDTPIEDALDEGAEENLPTTYSITSYGADYTIDSLVRRLNDNSIEIPPFQRGYVWNNKMACRFIESLLLGLPVPGIFLSKQKDTQKLLVVDGQQRLKTLQFFYGGVFEPTHTEFALRDVEGRFVGATYKSLEESDRRRLDDAILHATIVRQDEPTDDDSSIYQIFERLNTEGLQLMPQEIRACLYHGTFCNFLGELNQNRCWREIYGGISKRMRDQELILRFLALFEDASLYKKPMKKFLNQFMGKNRSLDSAKADRFREAFGSTIKTVHKAIGARAFKPRGPLNAAVYDSVMVGLARRLSAGPVKDQKHVARVYDELLEQEDYQSPTETSTSDEESIKTRISLATEAFRAVP